MARKMRPHEKEPRIPTHKEGGRKRVRGKE
jgi:hypothetical protein